MTKNNKTTSKVDLGTAHDLLLAIKVGGLLCMLPSWNHVLAQTQSDQGAIIRRDVTFSRPPSRLHQANVNVAIPLELSASFWEHESELPLAKLSDLFEVVQRDNPSVLESRASRDISHERHLQAIAALRPQVTLTSSSSSNRRDYKTLDQARDSFLERFYSQSTQINLTQPVWRPALWIAKNQSMASMAEARLRSIAKEQEIFFQVATSWFDWMSARDEVDVALSKLAATAHGLEVQRLALLRGVYSVIDLATAQVKFARSQTDLAEAAAAYHERKANLELQIGTLHNRRPPYLDVAFRQPISDLVALDEIVIESEQQSLSVQAARLAVEAAQAALQQQQAMHYPTLDLVASISRSAQPIGATPFQPVYRIKQDSIGFQLNMPLYLGGSQSSKVREAVAQLEIARQELMLAQRRVRLDVQQALGQLNTASIVLANVEVEVQAAGLSLDAAKQGARLGLKAQLDVLEAEQKLAESQRDSARARYRLGIAVLKLEMSRGRLNPLALRIFEPYWLTQPRCRRDVVCGYQR